MEKMFKDAGNQSIFWSSFGTVFALYSLQEWLAIMGLAIGVVSGLVNMYAKCREGQALKNDERRKEEIHQIKMERLKRGLRDEPEQD